MSDDQTPAPRKRIYNWFAINSILPRNPKVLSLRSDSARYAFIVALCAAREEFVISQGFLPDAVFGSEIGEDATQERKSPLRLFEGEDARFGHVILRRRWGRT